MTAAAIDSRIESLAVETSFLFGTFSLDEQRKSTLNIKKSQ
jgi:hypothetical protein